MSATRLLMLGAVRIFQPTHGYFVRRELMTWRADKWASLNPGSVYNALRTLEREGFLEEVEGAGNGAGPARTTYRLTPDGETEFFQLLREALWTVDCHDPTRLMTAISFVWALSREEVLAALEHRAAQLETEVSQADFQIADVLAYEGKPRHVAEFFHLSRERARGELEWTRAFARRIEAGEYGREGEPWPIGLPGTTSQA